MSNMNVLMHNMQSMFTNRQLGITNGNKAKSTEKLSSGYRINRAADDAAGLTISEKMRHQIRGLKQALRNIGDGIDYVKVADGALEETTEMLQRMNELAIKAANGTNTAQDRAAIDEEIKELRTELNRVFASTEFNTKKIWDPNTLGTNEIDTITGYHEVTGITIPGYSTSGTITNTNRNAFPRSSYKINADQDGLKVSWTAYSGKNYETSLINWPDGDPPASASFELKDYLDTAEYPELAGINAKFGYQVESDLVTKDDVIAMMDNSYIRSYVSNSETTYRYGTSEGVPASSKLSSTVSINYDAAIVSDRDFESADTSYIRAYPTNYTNFKMPSSDGDKFTFTFEMDGIGKVTATSTSLSYTSKDTREITKGETWEWRENFQTSSGWITRTVENPTNMSNAWRSFYSFSESSNLGGLKNIFNKEDKGLENGRGTHASNAGGTITMRLSLTADSPYKNDPGRGNQTNVGSMTITINTDASDTADSIVNALKTLGGIDISNYNSSGNTDTGQASTMTYSSTWVGRTGASISVPDHTITHESVRHKMEVPIQAGTYKGESAEIDIVYDNLDAEILGITDVNTLTRESSLEAIDKIGHAIDIVVDQRSQFGAYQNRLEHAQKINDNSAENTEYADSVIRDTDMAAEMVRLSKDNILQQAGQSMLAQSNQNRQALLNLLQ